MDIQGREQIVQMVNSFYEKVKVDDLLGGIFHQAIGNNWDAHLEKMYNFWESLLFHEPVYQGTPFPKHAALPIQEVHFNRWLLIFNENIDSQFEGPIAENAKQLGANIAKVFMAKMFNTNTQLNIV